MGAILTLLTKIPDIKIPEVKINSECCKNNNNSYSYSIRQCKHCGSSYRLLIEEKNKNEKT